jgi:hypothetical protein
MAQKVRRKQTTTRTVKRTAKRSKTPTIQVNGTKVVLAGTKLGINAKDEILGWLDEMEMVHMANRECLYFQRAKQDLEKNGKTYFAEVMVDRLTAHLTRCLKDPLMVEYQGQRIARELVRLGAYKALLENMSSCGI